MINVYVSVILVSRQFIILHGREFIFFLRFYLSAFGSKCRAHPNDNTYKIKEFEQTRPHRQTLIGWNFKWFVCLKVWRENILNIMKCLPDKWFITFARIIFKKSKIVARIYFETRPESVSSTGKDEGHCLESLLHHGGFS